MPHLLAVDLGLRTGLALYDADGRLVRYRSQNFGSLSRLKQGAFREVNGVPELDALVVEGDANLAKPWLRAAERRGAKTFAIHAHDWRPAILNERAQRSGRDAKEAADGLARAIIAMSGAKKPTSLRHDAAEAILIGWWGCIQLGWRDGPPSR